MDNNSNNINIQQGIIGLAMQLIALKNFKSYESQLINNLSPNINIIIGKNGQGKSNFFKAINFLLTDRVTINRNQFNAYSHRGIDNTVDQIAVEAYFKYNPANQGDSTLFKIQRIWKNDLTEEYKIQEKTYKKVQFQNYLQSIGIAYTNSYHIIQQGKIDQLTRMDDFQLFKLLEEATGMKKFERKNQQAQNHLRKIAIQKEEIKGILGEIQKRMKVYQSKKEQYEYYSYEQLAHKARSKNDYEDEIEKNTNEIENMKQRQSELSDQVVKMKIKSKELNEELQQLNQNISVNQKQFYEFQSSPQDAEIVKKSPFLNQEYQELNKKLKKIGENKNKMKSQFDKKSKETQAARVEMQNYKQKYNTLTAQLEGQKLGNTSKGKAQIKSTIQRLQQNIKQTEQDIKKMSNYLKEFKIKPGNKQSQESNTLKEKLNTITIELKAAKIKIYEQNRIKNQLEYEIDALSKQSFVYMCKMRKLMPLLDMNLVGELRKQKIPGVYGFLIQFIEIQPSVAFSYQMAGLSKLCTLLVQDQQACNKVIELNKKLKGKQINMLPVSVVRRQISQKKNYPSMPDCYSLLNQQWIKIKPHSFGQDLDKQLKKIIMNTFGKYALVKSYDLGLQISKKFYLNCITADKEIIYSQGLFCKVGKDQNIDDKIEIYYKYAEKEQEINKAHAKLEQCSKQLIALQNIELDLTKKKVDLEHGFVTVTKKLQEINYQKRALEKVQSELQNLQRKKKGFELQLRRMQQMQQTLDSKKIIQVNMKQYKQLEQTYNSKLKYYNKKNDQQYQIQTKLGKIAKEQQELIEKANKIKEQLQFNQSFSIEFVGQKEYKVNIEKQLKARQQRLAQIQKQIMKIEQQIAIKQSEDSQLRGKISLLTEQNVYYNKKLEEIGSIDLTLEQIQDKSNSLSMSFSHISMGKKNKTHYYSAKEKIFFAKLQSFRERMNIYLKQYAQVEQMEAHVRQMIEQCEKQKEMHLSQDFNQFKKQFQRIFSAVTRGQADVRLKRSQQKSRGFSKSRNAISIMVSFQAQREISKRWSQFSGGQKSVLSFCILMALQKCEPASYYVLDEIDAALDPAYLHSIINLIRQESQYSQYFITTFKRQMLDFSQEICNYYLIEMHERASTIKRISQETARQSINDIIA